MRSRDNNCVTVNDVDGLLGAFFKAEMPEPWPELRLPSLPLVRRRSWLPQARSRFALAAAVALLVAGAMLLGGSFRSAQMPAPDHGTPIATNPKMELILEQDPNGPTMIRITIDDPPAPR